MRRAFQEYFRGILAAAETGWQEAHWILGPATGSRCPMILAVKSSAMSRKPGILEFILNLLSHHHAHGFRKARKDSAPKPNWWPTSPGDL